MQPKTIFGSDILEYTTFISLFDQKHLYGMASLERNGKLSLIIDFKEEFSEIILSAIRNLWRSRS